MVINKIRVQATLERANLHINAVAQTTTGGNRNDTGNQRACNAGAIGERHTKTNTNATNQARDLVPGV
jgi:hypothetical protein